MSALPDIPFPRCKLGVSGMALRIKVGVFKPDDRALSLGQTQKKGQLPPGASPLPSTCMPWSMHAYTPPTHTKYKYKKN